MNKKKTKAGLVRLVSKPDGTVVFFFGRGGLGVGRKEVGRYISGVGEEVVGRFGRSSSVSVGGVRDCEGGVDVGVASCVDTQLAVGGRGTGGGSGNTGGSGSGGDDRSAVQGAVGDMASSGSGGDSVGVGPLDSVVVSEKTLANRAKRHRKRDAKARKRSAVGGDAVGRLQDVGSVGCGTVSGEVPEWRRGAFVDGIADRLAARGSSRGFFSGVSDVTRRRLVGTRAERLAAENELAAFKAQKQLERMKMDDGSRQRLADEKVRRQLMIVQSQDPVHLMERERVRLLRDTEKGKVDIEKAYASLSESGSRVKTVVTDGSSPTLTSGSISPNSSVSMKEIHDMMKELEVLKKEKACYEKKYGKIDVEEERGPASTTYTPDEFGEMPEYSYEREENIGEFVKMEDGRFHRVLEVFDY